MVNTHKYTLTDCKYLLFAVQAAAKTEWEARHTRGKKPGLIDIAHIVDEDDDRESEFCKILKEQSEEIVDIVLAVMYLGRDHYACGVEGGSYGNFAHLVDHDPKFEDRMSHLRVEDPEKYVREMRDDLYHLGWDKYQEIDVMHSKLPVLSNYLLRGLYILGLK